MTAHSDQTGALDGLLVLDLSRILAGPTATQLLGDLGATVLKIENPKTGGDDTRSWGPPYAPLKDGEGSSDLSAYFMAANRNKFSIPADLSNATDRAMVQALAERADILVENYKPGGLEKFGLHYEAVAEANPSIVYCSISGFGQTGPNRNVSGYDLMAQGFGGIMSLTGDPDGSPMKVGVGVADVMCGMYAAVGTLAALRHRDRTGEGQHIDLALVDSQMAWLINEGTNHLASGKEPARRGNAHPNIVPYDVFAASDGHVILAVGNDAQFQRFCAAFAREDLGGAPDYQTNPNRVRNRVALTAEIATTLANVTVTDILDRLQAVNVPCGPINTVSKALASDQAEARDTVVSMAHPETEAGAVRLLGNPLKLSKTPATYRQPPPVFGQDAGAIDAILAGLGKKLLGDQ